MKELIERLESASEGSRELDEAIAELVGWARPDRTIDFYPDYTTSLDAALTLVPEGRTVNYHTSDGSPETFPVGYNIEYDPEDGCSVELFYLPTWNIEPPHIASGCGPTPALALCIAALKAREKLATGEANEEVA